MAKKVTVSKGDTLSAIAKANNTTVAKIAAANPQITNVNKINVGQKITIPTAVTPKAPVPTPIVTPVKPVTAFNSNIDTTQLQVDDPRYTGPKPQATTTTWTKAGTVQTLTGPVDVDSLGKAADGSIPIAVSKEELPPSPGAGYIWSGKDWVKPSIPQDGKTYTWDNDRGWVAQALNTATTTTTQVDSIASIKALLSSYGIGDLGDAITNAVVKGYSTDTIQLIMQDPNSNDPLAVAFQIRFPANKARAAAGKTVLSPAEYLRAERSYTEVLKSYGVSNLASKEKLSQFISNDISATEVADRVGIAINRVQNADPDTKKALAEYYPMLNQADIVGAVLDPTEGLPALQRKIQIAEIGGAALAQGIKTSEGKTNIMMGASALADLGVTQAKAREGFQTVAEVTPRGEFLSQISPGENYGQLQAEQEAFQGLASAKRARVSLTEQERARFGGSSGVNKASLGSQTRGAI
jgi:murein DD-endopeptidase MepM/ murein hydrolase activator NlpD